jgi:aminomethyltransferase
VTETERRTPLYDHHQRLGARLVPFAGYAMPLQYRGITVEHQAVRERAGIFDASHMGELWFEGARALVVTNLLITNDLTRVEPGQALYTCCCNAAGGILDDLIVYPWSASRVLIVCNASNRAKIATHFAAHAEPEAVFTDRSDATCLLALQGPRAVAILERTGCRVELRSFRFGERSVAGRPCTVARTGYTGEDGVEIFCSDEDAPHVFQAILDAGTPLGLEPAGLGARDTLRLEARLSLYGNEIDETTNPLEAGLGWVTKLDKPDFVGKGALLAVQAAGLRRKLVGFEMTGRGIARHGYRLLDTSGAEVGICTSGAPSPTLGKAIGLGYLPVGLATVGTEFLVDCRGKSIGASVVKTPFYRRTEPG